MTNPNTYESQKKRGYRRKLKLISMMGGKCSTCGYNKNLAALSFHHLDPSKKSFVLDMRGLSNNAWKVSYAEAQKCMLLCRNCHAEIHHPNLNTGNFNINKVLKTAEKPVPLKNYCCDCGQHISKRITRCLACHNHGSRDGQYKISWPSTKELIKMVTATSYVAVGRKLGVSDNAIRKRIKHHPLK